MNSGERPTRVRYVVVGAASLMSALLYLDRFCISFAEVYIQEDLGLTNAEVGWMLSAFFWTYALGQVPAGWLTDRFGSRIMLTTYVLLWSLFTGLSGGVSAFAALLAMRFGFGFSQSGAYPTASSIVSKWVPFYQRATASGVIAFGGRVGGFLALFASGHMIVWLTPSDVETDIKPSDLLNPPRLCSELVERPKPETPASLLRQKCFEHFSTDGRETVRQLAAESASVTSQEGDAEGVAGVPTTEADILVNELNSLIHTRDFFQFSDLEGISAEKEAVRLMQREAEDLTTDQVGRLNRLIIEGLFRDSVKKLYVAGWRPMMFVYGSLGIIVAGLIWWSCYTTPADHPRCNDAEVALISGQRPMEPLATGKVAGVPLRPLLKSQSMWSSCLTQWFTNIGWVFLMTWAPRYLTNVHHLSIELRAMLVSIPPLVGWAGMLSGGAITDLSAQRLGLRWGRALPISLSRFVAMLAYIGCLFEPSAIMAVAMFSIVAFATDFGTPAMWAFTQDVGGRYVGSVLGWGNMWGNLGAAVTPPVLIWIIGPAEN